MGMTIYEIKFEKVRPLVKDVVARIEYISGLEVFYSKYMHMAVISSPLLKTSVELGFSIEKVVEISSQKTYAYLPIVTTRALMDLGGQIPTYYNIRVPKWSSQRWEDRKWWQFIAD